MSHAERFPGEKERGRKYFTFLGYNSHFRVIGKKQFVRLFLSNLAILRRRLVKDIYELT